MTETTRRFDPAAWRAAFDVSWRANGKFIRVNLAVALALCVFMSWLGDRVGWGPLYFFTDFREQERYEGLMTLASAGGFAVGSWGLLMVARLRRRRKAPPEERRAWIWGAVGLAALAVDDLAMVHEWWSAKLSKMGMPHILGDVDQDAWIIAAYAVAALIVGWRLLPSILASTTAVAPLVLAGGFFAASQVLDFIPWEGLSRPQQEWLGPSEEILKTLGAWCIGLFGLLLAEGEADRPFGTKPKGS